MIRNSLEVILSVATGPSLLSSSKMFGLSFISLYNVPTRMQRTPISASRILSQIFGWFVVVFHLALDRSSKSDFNLRRRTKYKSAYCAAISRFCVTNRSISNLQSTSTRSIYSSEKSDLNQFARKKFGIKILDRPVLPLPLHSLRRGGIRILWAMPLRLFPPYRICATL